MLIPYGWLVLQSFTNPEGFFTLENWTFMTQETMIRHGVSLPVATKPMLNSLKFATLMALCVVPVTVCAAYPLSRTDFIGRKLLARLLIIMDAFPQVALLTSFIILLSKMHLTNKLIGVIFLKVAMYLPGSIWLMKGFFDHINWDIEWAAIVDGAGPARIFFQIIFPLMKSITTTSIIFNTMWIWNDFIAPNIFLSSRANTTLVLEIFRAKGQFTTNWSAFMTFSVVTIFPIFVFYCFMQKHIIKGLTAGAVKG